MRQIYVPKNLTPKTSLEFIEKCSKLFSLQGKREPNFILDLSSIKKHSIIGLLLIYKIIEYTSINQCFFQPKIYYNNIIDKALIDFGFKQLLSDFLIDSKANEKLYKELSPKVENNFLIAPQALLRESDYSTRSIKTKFSPIIESYYSKNKKGVNMILTCFSEILLNFWEHAKEDNKSIIIASGNHQKVEIACADTGDGIISTLRQNTEFQNLDSVNILEAALKKGVTSKPNSFHMGCGLWIINEIVKLVKGKLYLYSENAFYINEFGKISKGQCMPWKGTVIYLYLPLSDPKTTFDLESVYQEDNLKEININWG